MKKKKASKNHFRSGKKNNNKSDYNKPKKYNKRLTQNFLETAFRCKASGKLKISLGLVGALELLATRYNEKIKILKGYESPDSVEKKSFRKNYHSLGVAADIQIGELSLRDQYVMVKSIKEFKGIGINLDENYIHVDSRKDETVSVWFERDEGIIPFSDEKFEEFLPQSST